MGILPGTCDHAADACFPETFQKPIILKVYTWGVQLCLCGFLTWRLLCILTGIIYLISALGHLVHSVLFLTVSARDGGGLPSATNAAITVNILQTASAPAVFERSRYAFSVPEDAPKDSPVGTVKAREPPSKLRCQMLPCGFVVTINWNYLQIIVVVF